jgi:YesN/AraC family two-component response regulator
MPTAPSTAVSQLAPMPCLTFKTKPAKGLEAGQPHAGSLHTPAHMGEHTAHTVMPPQTIDTKKVTDFIALVKALYPTYSVAFSKHSLLQKQFSDGSKKHFDLFIDLVKAFTLLHHNNRKTSVENIVATCDNDYIQAYELWQLCQPKQQQTPYMPTLQKVLQFLQYSYQNENFTIATIATQLNYSAEYIGRIFEQLQQQKKIQVLENNKRLLLFKLLA